MKAALDVVEKNFELSLRTLERLVRIPGISARSFPSEDVRRSAEETANVLEEWGMDRVRILESSGHPAVYGERIVAQDAPTVLIYGHHDVQPPGRIERWVSPPFEPDTRDGRMFGRGTADDKGGFLAYLSAVRACHESAALPCNIRMLIEGEEEIGSPHLSRLLEEFRPLFGSDFIVLCDTPNLDTGVPALTYRLRGNCIVDVEVLCLERPIHSGQGGGVVPDATMILCRLLSSLFREDGSLDIEGLEEKVEVDERQLEMIRALPLDTARYSKESGMLEGVSFTTDRNLREENWTRPSLTITAFESVPMAQAANQIADAARARLSMRTVPNMTTSEAGEMLTAALRSRVPFGAHLRTNVIGGPTWWESDPHHPIFEAARRALGRGFGSEPVMAGSGGSIGFVKPFADIAGEVPPLLTGVQDRHSNAHSENESLHLGDFRKAIQSAVHLFDELAAIGRRKEKS